jgi:predicted NAD-dependent protein-ADP-ribosyltransferase YbiA (DUF1768 family)
MSPHQLTDAGSLQLSGTWRTAEALFQAARFADPAICEEIRACRSPMQAKMIAKRNADRMVVAPRGPQDLVHMELILRLKIAQHADLKRQLGEIPNDALIVEDVTARGVSESNVFWGAAFIKDEWVGENHLGRLWMGIRAALLNFEDGQIDMLRRLDDRSS